MKHQHFLGNQDLVLYRFIIFPPRLSQAIHSTIDNPRHNPLCRNHHEKLNIISIFFPVVILPSPIPSFWGLCWTQGFLWKGIWAWQFISKSLHAFLVDFATRWRLLSHVLTHRFGGQFKFDNNMCHGHSSGWVLLLPPGHPLRSL